MKRTLQTQKAPAIFVILMTISTGMMLFTFKKNYNEMGFNWMWWFTIVIIGIYVAYFITKHVLNWGDIEIDNEKIGIKEFPSRRWSFGWDQIEGFGTKKILFMEFPTIKPKPLLIPKDEIVILHRYEKKASEIADFLNKTYQNKTLGENSEPLRDSESSS